MPRVSGTLLLTIFTLVSWSAQAKTPSEHLSSAKQFYTTGKYSDCLDELEKLHKILASYKNSKQLEGFCHQGLTLRWKDAKNKLLESFKSHKNSDGLTAEEMKMDMQLKLLLSQNERHEKTELVECYTNKARKDGYTLDFDHGNKVVGVRKIASVSPDGVSKGLPNKIKNECLRNPFGV